MMKSYARAALLFTLLGAAPRPSPAPAAFSFSDWTLTTQGQTDYNWVTGAFNTPTHVVATRPGDQIEADSAVGNFKQHKATLTGHVVLHDMNGALTRFAGQKGKAGPATLTCDTLTIDGITKTYVALGNVRFTQGTSVVTAARAVLDGATHEIHLFGDAQHPVQITQ
jgi:lipopolysaccharide assembly outer membrane protein LptD (OstA)